MSRSPLNLFTSRCSWFALALLVATSACGLGDYTPDPAAEIDAGLETPASAACSGSCHGSGSEAAPPTDTSGLSDPSYTGVGAHRAHLAGADWHKPVACENCHLIPVNIGDPGHIDTELPAEINPTGLMEGATWNGATCSNNYCHGSALTGGTDIEPVWTEVDGTKSQCGSCHGAPPPAPHPAGDDCGSCHPTMNPGEGLVIAYPDLHIDGHLDVIDAQACDSCHGSGGDSAPPTDTLGNSALTDRGVGAHQVHLDGTGAFKAVACVECHRIPAGISDIGHVDTPLPAELIFGALAGADTTWNGASCAGSYCHGSTLGGGTQKTPTWTLVDGSQSQCGDCHGAPPPAPHPADADCGSCHPTMNPGGGLVIAYPELHVDGKVDVTNDQACDSCHGSGGIAAPPLDTQGGSATTLRSVGAHRRHLDPSAWRKDIPCAECHRVPSATIEQGHIDSPLPAELSFGVLAGNATWNGSTCSNTYCHGATLNAGGTSTNPSWTNVDGSQGQCGSCHGAPPPPPHPVSADCGACHDTMAAGGGLVITDPTRHIDGNLDVTGDQACDSCHGSGGNAAPPLSVGGASATNTRGVGAHRNHLATSTWHKPMACTDCHRSPGAVGAVGHLDTPLPAELTFSTLAGTTTTWNGSRCSNNYCHGSSLAGGTANVPLWTLVDGSQSACGSCHGAPPPPPHPVSADCGACHNTMSPGGGLVIVDEARHIDGNLDVDDNQACDSCHGAGGDPAPPTDTAGNSSTATRGVGAHQTHVNTSTEFKQTVCAECHRVPAATGAVGHIDTALPAELSFTGRGAGTAWNGSTCANSYCHGATLNAGGTKTAPSWTQVNGSANACGACHGTPPPPPHPADPSCENCHGEVVGPGMTITTPSKHIDGALQVTAVHPPGWSAGDQHGHDVDQNGIAGCATAGCHGTALTGGASNVSCESCHTGWKTNCTFCHGGTDNNLGAPPASVFGLTARSAPEVGAHTEHVTASATHGKYDCTACHTKPTSALSPNHLDGAAGAEMRFSTLNSAATYNATAATCATMYCHGTGRAANGSGTWTSTAAIGCTGCHGDTAAGPAMGVEHVRHIKDKKLQCNECHQTVVNAARGIIAPTLHVDGARQVSIRQGGTYNAGTKLCSNLACHQNDTWR